MRPPKKEAGGDAKHVCFLLGLVGEVDCMQVEIV